MCSTKFIHPIRQILYHNSSPHVTGKGSKILLRAARLSSFKYVRIELGAIRTRCQAAGAIRTLWQNSHSEKRICIRSTVANFR